MRLALAAALLLAPSAAMAADTPLDAAAFEAYVTGHTLTYSQGGTVFGTEQYLPGRTVRWAFTGGECTDGTWYQDAEYICFVYPTDPQHQCWTFYLGADGLTARYKGDPPGMELSEVAQSPEPLICPGPDVGV